MGTDREAESMTDSVRILGIAGSLRKRSYNRAALRAAATLIPHGSTLENFDLDGVPPFNEDHEKEFPPRAREFKSKVAAADAILIVIPEYNYSVPRVLKNAIDWASRPYGESAWNAKPVGIMGALPGMLGTAPRAISFASNVCFPEHVSLEPAGGHDRQCL
jgi:chromate reductase, NAD(P)H dehydrogenase (quinone)